MSDVKEAAKAKVKKVKEPKAKKKREPRKDISFIDVTKIVAVEGYNIRIDYGDLSDFEATIENNVEKIPPLKGHREKGMFLITDGFRRQLAGLNVFKRTGKPVLLPVYPEPMWYTEEDRLTDMFLLNEGKALNMLEQAGGFKRFREKHSLTDVQIAKKIHKSPTYVRNCFLLLQAPEETKQYIVHGVIAPSLVIDLFKEHGIEKAVQIIQDTISNISSQPRQLVLNVTAIEAPKPSVFEFVTNNEESPSVNKDDFHDTSITDNGAGEKKDFGIINPTGTKTDEELQLDAPDDHHDSNSGDVISPLKIRRIKRSDIDRTIEKFDSVGAFKRIWGDYKKKGWALNPAYADEFAFWQRMAEGAVSPKEISLRYFKFMDDDKDMPF